MCAAMVDRNAEYPDYGRPMYDSQPQNDYGRQSYDYNRPTYDSYQQPGDYNRSSYDAPRGQDYPPYQTSSDPPVVRSFLLCIRIMSVRKMVRLLHVQVLFIKNWIHAQNVFLVNR